MNIKMRVRVVLCLLLPLLAKAHDGKSHGDVATLVQAKMALATEHKATVDVTALRSTLVAAQHELSRLVGHSKISVGSGPKVDSNTIRALVKEASIFMKDSLNTSRKESAKRPCPACCYGFALDAFIVTLEVQQAGRGGFPCTILIMIYWWLMGIHVLLDEGLSFPEAMHVLMQQSTSVGYGSTTPTTHASKLFHGLHTVVSQLGMANIQRDLADVVLDVLPLQGGQDSLLGPKGNGNIKPALATLMVMIAVTTFYFTEDLYKGSSAGSYPTWVSAMFDAFYQTLLTMTTVGYGDFSLQTKAGKIASPFEVPLLTRAFDRFVSALQGPSGEDLDEDDEPPSFCSCFMYKMPVALCQK